MKDLTMPANHRVFNQRLHGISRVHAPPAESQSHADNRENTTRARRREASPSPLELRHLHDRYPISLRHLFAQTVPWLLCVGLVTTLIGLANIVDDQMFLRILPPYNAGGLLYMLLTVIFTSAYFLYLVLYRQSFGYWIEQMNFVIKKGVIFRTMGAYPLHRINDVYIGCAFPQALLGLYYLEVRTPSHDSEEFARIEGLSRKNALAIKSSLLGALASLGKRNDRTPRGAPLYQ